MAGLTKRQMEILTECAGPHGFYDHTRWDTGVLNRLYENGFALRSINGTGKWHATQAGRAALAETAEPSPSVPSAHRGAGK